MKILLTGVTGQLGFDVKKTLDKTSVEVYAPNRQEMDISSEESIAKYIEDKTIDAIIHCAAYTAVDKAETETVLNDAINIDGTKFLVEIAKQKNIKLMFISTDYVFDGTKETPYVEDDIRNPINRYGLSKKLAEDIIINYLEHYFILRISWVIGTNGNNFVKTMLRLGNERDELNVINDQTGSPTFTKDLAPLISNMILTDKYGIYHVTNEGYCTWHELATKIFKLKKFDVKVNPILTSEYKTDAKRPLNSKMSKNKLIEAGFEPLQHWEESLKEYLKIMDRGE